MSGRLVLLFATLALAACATSRLPPPVPATIGERIAAAAVAQIGQPYRYGGATPGGFDCSGLVVHAAAAAGVSVPRTTAQQLTAGVAIDRRQLRAGDLVFMQLSRKDLHVGVALDDVRFVHAPSRGGRVRIDALDAPPYARGFIGARRVDARRVDARRGAH